MSPSKKLKAKFINPPIGTYKLTPLMDEEIDIIYSLCKSIRNIKIEFARALEKAHGIT